MAPQWPLDGQEGHTMAPKWPKTAPRWPQDGPRWPKMAPSWPQVSPRWAPNGPKRGPKSLPNRSSEAFQHRSRKSECDPQSEIRIWAPFWALLGPTCGIYRAPGARLRPLKTIKLRNIKSEKTMYFTRFFGPRRVQEGAMFGSCWGQVGLGGAS